MDPAVKGTLNVLRSCAKVSSIKRVILTSSMAAVIFNGKPLSPDVTVDETWFSDSAFCERTKVHFVFFFLWLKLISNHSCIGLKVLLVIKCLVFVSFGISLGKP